MMSAATIAPLAATGGPPARKPSRTLLLLRKREPGRGVPRIVSAVSMVTLASAPALPWMASGNSPDHRTCGQNDRDVRPDETDSSSSLNPSGAKRSRLRNSSPESPRNVNSM